MRVFVFVVFHDVSAFFHLTLLEGAAHARPFCGIFTRGVQHFLSSTLLSLHSDGRWSTVILRWRPARRSEKVDKSLPTWKAAGADDKIGVRSFFIEIVPKSLRCTSLEKEEVAETLDSSVRGVSCQLYAGCVELGKPTGV